MSRRKLLTEDERAHLFGIPIDEAGLARRYTSSPDDLELLHAKRGAPAISSALPCSSHCCAILVSACAAMRSCPTRCRAIWRNNWVFRSVRSVTTPPGRKRDRTTPGIGRQARPSPIANVATCR